MGYMYDPGGWRREAEKNRRHYLGLDAAFSVMRSMANGASICIVRSKADMIDPDTRDALTAMAAKLGFRIEWSDNGKNLCFHAPELRPPEP